MRKKFLINLLLLVSLNLLIKPFWIFGIDRSFQNEIGAESYGLYFAVMNFSFLFSFFLDFGLTGFNNRNIARHEHMLNKYFSSILGIKIILSLLYALVSIIAAFLIGYDSVHFKLLLWVGLNQILASAILFFRSNISGLQKFKTDSLLSVLDRFLMIIFASVLLWGNVFSIRLDIFLFAGLQTLAYAVTAVIAFFLVVRYSGFKRIHWDKALIFVIFRQSLPYAILSFLMLFYFRVDSVMIERLLPDGSREAGIYASAYRVLDALNMFAYLFSVLLLPMFSRQFVENKDPGKLIKMSFALIFSAAALVSAFVFWFPDEIVGILYHEHRKESAEVMKILLLGFIPVSTIYIFGTLLTAHGSLKKLNIIACAGMVFNIAMNLLLIPLYQGVGAAYVSVLTQSIVAISQLIITIRIVKPEISLLYWLSIILFGLSIFLIPALLTYFNQNFIVISLCMGFSWLLFLSFFSIPLLRSIVKNKLLLKHEN